jgi:hypothetical protein
MTPCQTQIFGTIFSTFPDSKLWHNYYLIACQTQNYGKISIQHPANSKLQQNI